MAEKEEGKELDRAVEKTLKRRPYWLKVDICSGCGRETGNITEHKLHQCFGRKK